MHVNVLGSGQDLLGTGFVRALRSAVSELRAKREAYENSPVLGPQRFPSRNPVTIPEQNRIIVDERGVFVPRTIFGVDVQIKYEVQRASQRGARVILFGEKPADRIDCKRSRDAHRWSLEQRWLDEHRSEFAGQWVALDGDRLLAHGNNAREVYADAKASGVDLPLVLQIEPVDELPFGGW